MLPGVTLLTCGLIAQIGAADQGPAGVADDGRALDVNALTFTIQASGAAPEAHGPPRIVLGDTKAVDVVISAKRADGAPLDVALPQLRVSTGSVTAPRRTAPGTWVTTFTPPAELFPHVAILFATIETATTTAVGFVPLHLWGKGQTTVKTKPRSKVTVFIGNEAFGPVDADPSGAAKVAIVVPPGPERAVARSIDEVGNESQKTIDLGVPSFNRLAAVALDDTVSADGTGAARVLAFVVDKKGEPLFDAKLKGKASIRGAVVEDGEGLAPGMFRLLVRPGKVDAAKRTSIAVDIALEGAPGSTAKTTVELLTGRAARATLEPERTSLSADDPRQVGVVLRVFDAGGNPVPARAASVDVDVGRIDALDDVDGSQGLARRVTWVLPAELTNKPKATLRVRAHGGNQVLATQDIALFAGKPARAAFDRIEPVVADGASSVEVRLRVADQAGNPLVPTGATLTVDASIGRFVAGTVDGRVYRARFVPEPRDRNDIAQVTGTVGGLRVDTTVRLMPRPRARLLVGGGVLVGTNYGALVQSGPDVSLLVRLPGLDGSVHAGLHAAMLQSVSAPPGVDHRAYPLSVEGAWRPLLTPDLAVHVGAAAGFVLTDETSGAARVVSPGALVQIVSGIGYRLGPGFVELDLRVGYGDTSPTSPAVGLPLGASAVVGYRFGI